MSFDGIRKDANGNGLVDQFLTTVANPFHLLSEGDAATLGKYNSHYSDDVLAHLIGEPIPGNCFMWSAPHQPFVLPVRVRSFEGLYRGNVNHDQGAQALTNIRAQQVLEATSGALARLKNDLLQKLKAANVRYVKVPQGLPGGGEGIGILSGQLFYLIKEVKQPADTQPEEHLKKPLLSLILGEGAVHLAKHPTSGKDYFCAKPEDWERVLRFPPKAEDSQPLSSEKSK